MTPQSTHIALGLGANIGDGPAALREAAAQLARAGVEQLTLSPLYATSPIGPQDQPDYTNAAAAGRTRLPYRDLLALCKDIEQRMGRSPGGRRWGPRPIDIDILIYGNLAVNEPDLIIPHAEMGNRLFVLAPLLDVAAHMRLPSGETVQSFAETHIHRLESSDQKIRKIIEM